MNSARPLHMSRSGDHPIPRKPGLRKASARRFDADLQAARVLDAWMTKRGISNGDIAECLDVSESIVRDLRRRERPLHVGDLLTLPPRYALALLDELRAAVVTGALAVSTENHR